MTENKPLAHQSIADALESLRVQKAAGAPADTIVSSVRNLRGQIYSIKDPVERARLFAVCSELLKPF